MYFGKNSLQQLGVYGVLAVLPREHSKLAPRYISREALVLTTFMQLCLLMICIQHFSCGPALKHRVTSPLHLHNNRHSIASLFDLARAANHVRTIYTCQFHITSPIELAIFTL